MSGLVDKAAAILQEAAESMRKITDEFVDRGEGGLAEANLAYRSTASLQVFASQMSGEKKVYEGPCEVDNGRDLVSIDGFEVRDNIQFEILYEGKWIKGHRYHSQYGQAFSWLIF